MWLNRCGIMALRLSMPIVTHRCNYFLGHERADHLVGSNIGLTLQANRQAVLSTFAGSLQWLASQGYGKLGLVERASARPWGLSPWPTNRWFARSSPACLHLFCRRGAHGNEYAHVWEGLRANVTADELRRFWLPISRPLPRHAPRMRGSRQKMLMVSARYDPTFLPKLFRRDHPRSAKDGDGKRASFVALRALFSGACPFEAMQSL